MGAVNPDQYWTRSVGVAASRSREGGRRVMSQVRAWPGRIQASVFVRDRESLTMVQVGGRMAWARPVGKGGVSSWRRWGISTEDKRPGGGGDGRATEGIRQGNGRMRQELAAG